MTESQMYFHTVDYRNDRSESGWINRGFWLERTPRLTPLCRLFGHRPVVDGVTFSASRVHRERRSRWACCDRCGIRLQQSVDPDLELGQPYTDPIPASGLADDVRGSRGSVGGQIVLWGGGHSGVSVEVKVGNPGSEQTLAGHVRLSRLGALFLHTERHGTWLQRRLNPVGYESRIIGVSVHDGRAHWKLWAKRDSWSSDDPKWQTGSFHIDPRTILFGPLRYSYEDVGDPVEAVVRMPHGDDHPVTLQLQRCSHGRDRLRRKSMSWSVQWDAPAGIPTKTTDRGRMHGSAVTVTDQAAEGDWVSAACSAIAGEMTRFRVSYEYRLEAAAAGEAW